MAEIIIAVSADAAGNLSNIYIGPDFTAAKQALSGAIAGGSPIGYVFKNPIATTTLRSSTPAGTAPAPTITALNPNTGPANADITVAITGTGFDPATLTVLVGATVLAPTPTPTATNASVLIPAADIAAAATVQITVKNGDGQQSGPLAFTVT